MSLWSGSEYNGPVKDSLSHWKKRNRSSASTFLGPQYWIPEAAGPQCPTTRFVDGFFRRQRLENKIRHVRHSRRIDDELTMHSHCLLRSDQPLVKLFSDFVACASRNMCCLCDYTARGLKPGPPDCVRTKNHSHHPKKRGATIQSTYVTRLMCRNNELWYLFAYAHLFARIRGTLFAKDQHYFSKTKAGTYLIQTIKKTITLK